MEDNIETILQGVSNDFREPLEFAFTVLDEPLYLFDSTYPGRDLAASPADSHRIIHLVPGEYGLRSGFYKPDENTSLLLHRFTPKST